MKGGIRMKKLLSLIICLTIIFSCVSVFAASTDDEIEYAKQMITEKKNNTPDEEKTNEIFVKAIDNSETEKIIKEALKGFEYEIVKQYELSKAYLVKFESVQKADEAIDILNARKDIKYAQPNYYISLPTSVGNGGFTAPIYTFENLTNISAENVKKVSIIYNNGERIPAETSSTLIISNIINTFKDMQFVEDTREGGAGGWLYFINFYMKDDTYIQFGTRIHIDKADYNVVFSDTALEKMAYYHDFMKNIDSSEWATDYILECQELGFLEDVTDLSYKEPITREKFCEIVYNMISKATDKKWSVPTAIPFVDTYNSKVATLYYEDIIKGKGDKIFAPNDYLTREEAATIIDRIYENGVPLVTGTTGNWVKFADESEISDWALYGVQNAWKQGIMIGTGSGKFAPKDLYTTEQAITSIVRMYHQNFKGISQE